MKTVPLRTMKQELSRHVDKAQKDYIVITRHGRPAAVVWSVEGRDFEDLFYMTNRAFWTTLRKRRSQRTTSFAKAAASAFMSQPREMQYEEVQSTAMA